MTEEPRFICITDRSVPEESTRLLREACTARGIPFDEIFAYEFDFDPDYELQTGDMLYKTAVAMAAGRVEQFLVDERVATFYDSPSRVYFDCMNSSSWMDRAGVPVPRAFHCHSMDRDAIRRTVDRLGGLPIVIKTPGGEGGVGTMVADTYPVLFSLLDYILGRGTTPQLIAYVPGAMHWRVVVVGKKGVAAYPNPEREADFRSTPSGDSADYTASPDVALEATAVSAVKALGMEFGGVDVLWHPSGRMYVLEVNMPCYYPQAQLMAGIDVAGAMVGYLARKSKRIRKRARREDA
ncbi:MAG: RimK family alpha-L-glutamate ligase [Dehalococcoidia bacterium]